MNIPEFNTNTKVAKYLLKQHRDGLTAAQICALTGWEYKTAIDSCVRVNGVYVDRWVINETGNVWVRVFCLGTSADAPKPEISPKQYRMMLEAV